MAAARARPFTAARPDSHIAIGQQRRCHRAGRGLALPAQAAGGGRTGGSGGGGKRSAAAAQPREQRTNITFRVPGEPPMLFTRITQADLTDLLRLHGANGFATVDGKLSRRLEDLQQGDAVDLVLPKVLPVDNQVDNDGAANHQQVAAFLQQHAASEQPGSTITVLQTEPFKDRNQQDFVQLDTVLVAGSMLLAAEHKRVLGEGAVVDLLRKFAKIKQARLDGSSPALVEALQGVTHAQLFLAGEAVRAGLTVQEMVDMAAAAGMGVVLPSGQALGVVGAAPPVQL